MVKELKKKFYGLEEILKGHLQTLKYYRNGNVQIKI